MLEQCELVEPQLQFPGSWLLSILVRPWVSCFCTALPICLSERSEVYSLPRLWIGCSVRSGVFSPPVVNTVLPHLTPSLIERLQDFAGLVFILAHPVSSSRWTEKKTFPSTFSKAMFLNWLMVLEFCSLGMTFPTACCHSAGMHSFSRQPS